MYPVTGLLDPETGALLRAALEPLAAPKHTAQERDLRTVSQRMHDAVRDAATAIYRAAVRTPLDRVAETFRNARRVGDDRVTIVRPPSAFGRRPA